MKVLIFTGLLVLSASLYANEAYANGEELFNEAKCMECHNREDFKQDVKKVKDIKVLHQRVEACAINSDAGWFDDETQDVVHYLNKKHYKFEDAKK